MPEISRFLGIVIGMFYNEHGVAHFHAVYGDHEASIEIEGGTVHGDLPRRALRIAGELGVGAPRPSAEQDRAIGVTDMKYHVVAARHVRGHTVWLRFRDGTSGEIDLGSSLRGPVMEPLKDVETFRQFSIHPEFHTLVWPNGADFAPEFLHDNIQVTA